MENNDPKWKIKVLILISIMLFILVLIGVYVLEPITSCWEWVIPLIPFIVLVGFFVFLVSVVLFAYAIYLLLKN